MSLRRVLAASLAIATCALGAPSTAQYPSVLQLVDRYADGEFEAVVELLHGDADYGGILTQLRRDGPVWIEAGGTGDRARRELAAATFALEAARAGAWREWKLIQRQPQMCADSLAGESECYQPPNILYWKAPPLLIEWGCALLRRHPTPQPVERWWQLAALAVAQRAEDPQFLIGDTKIGFGIGAGEIGNVQDEIKHLHHVTPRFEKEMRFALAQGIARDRDLPADAMAERVQTETDSTIDPCWMYWQGQYRFHPQAMARIREMRR